MQGLLHRVSQGGDLHVPGGHKVACATHLVHYFRDSVNWKSGLSKMIYPSTVPLQEVVTFTYRAPVFDLPGGLRGVNLPPLQEDDLPTETCLGGRL